MSAIPREGLGSVFLNYAKEQEEAKAKAAQEAEKIRQFNVTTDTSNNRFAAELASKEADRARAKEEFDARHTLLQAQENRAQAEYDRNETAYNKKLAEENAYRETLKNPSGWKNDVHTRLLNADEAKTLIEGSADAVRKQGEYLNEGVAGLAEGLSDKAKQALIPTSFDSDDHVLDTKDLLTKLNSMDEKTANELGISKNVLRQAFVLGKEADAHGQRLASFRNVRNQDDSYRKDEAGNELTNIYSPTSNALEHAAISAVGKQDAFDNVVATLIARGVSREDAEKEATRQTSTMMTEAERQKLRLENVKTLAETSNYLEVNGNGKGNGNGAINVNFNSDGSSQPTETYGKGKYNSFYTEKDADKTRVELSKLPLAGPLSNPKKVADFLNELDKKATDSGFGSHAHNKGLLAVQTFIN
jgi:hypothetical protein